MTSSTDLITAFINAWSEKDIEKLLGFFTDDAIYTNIPIDPPNHGKAEIRAFLEGFIQRAEAIEFVVHYQAETAEGVVLNERTDRFLIDGQWLELPVMGIFEVTGGKISAWRDYFDRAQMGMGG